MSDVPQVREPATHEALRAEHDALAERLAIRASVDAIRKALYLTFFGLLSVGLTVKLAWDRFGTPRPGVVRRSHPGLPLLLWTAVAVAVVLLGLAIRSFVVARRIAREEDARYARYRELRSALGLDA